MIDNFELDERMTEETKEFDLKKLKSGPVPNELNKYREVMFSRAIAANASYKFDKIQIKEIKIINKSDNYEIPVSVYIPDNLKKNSPITIYYHGGALVNCYRENYHIPVSIIAKSTQTVWLSVEYRLCPENKFPIPISDCQRVLEYVSDNKREFSSEDANVVVSGDSIGGYIIALLCNDFNHLINAQVSICPFLDFSNTYDSLEEFKKPCYNASWITYNETRKKLWFEEGSFVNSPAVSPILKEDLSKIPKTFILAAELDKLRDQALCYHKRLQECGVESVLLLIKGVIHDIFSSPLSLKNAFREFEEEVIKFYKTL